MELAKKDQFKTFYSKEEIPNNTLFFSLQLREDGRQHADSNYLVKFKGQFYNFFELENPVLLKTEDSFFLNERLNNIQAINIQDEDFYKLSDKFFEKLLAKNK